MLVFLSPVKIIYKRQAGVNWSPWRFTLQSFRSRFHRLAFLRLLAAEEAAAVSAVMADNGPPRRLSPVPHQRSGRVAHVLISNHTVSFLFIPSDLLLVVFFLPTRENDLATLL